MASSAIRRSADAVPAKVATRPGNAAGLIPGVLLLAVVGYAGKFIEHFIASYGKAHHMVLPNIEYVLWAILIGLAIYRRRFEVGEPAAVRLGLELAQARVRLDPDLQRRRHRAGAGAAGAGFAIATSVTS